ncbi:hypothetical protein [Opitutus sp. ER46]|uniref:hypothetical protein n=1 Tax=Opitutus sp. ER46 TaxID=2161864 RepID=UPI000D312A44|nr:hypothetical protein [Opitutus sp. ER46]PTX95779.1 hypothetical protein DB354_10230 [Opitutus sp. ER46]
MALQKSITLPNGATGDYIHISEYARDVDNRYVSCHLNLFTSAAHYASQPAPKQPICLIAKLRLSGAKYDAYLSTAALAAVADTEDAVRAQLYVAAKVEPLIAGGGLQSISLVDALDV